ncbi:Firmicu-CTERM sorting domain-containing protein [Loigolactobacillus binensis]|uniref:Firmicu-CTERM sorting domain-containing protein n=1 Tax=Loigolactobacillus binensis TaxID=2559922 RepID=A0ABW3EH26_9LACO|nr:Firmicu-CTERM sorting domain-containing protein [Loigolactobacillus binensis]
MRKLLLSILTFAGALIFALTTSAVQAAVLGTPDWSGVTATSFGYDGTKTGTYKITTDGTYLYFQVNMGSLTSSIPNDYQVTIGSKDFTLTTSETNGTLTLSARGGGTNWQTISNVGSAVKSVAGTSPVLTAKVSLATLGVKQTNSAQAITLSCYDLGLQKATATLSAAPVESTTGSDSNANSTSNSSSTTSSSSSANAVSQALAGSSSDQATTDSDQAANNNTAGSLGITIDGDFSDWADKDMSDMYITGDSDNLKKASLLADEDNIYFYVAMMPKLGNGGTSGYADFQASGYQLNVGGVIYDLDFNNNSTVTLSVGQKQAVTLGVYNEKTAAYTAYTNDAYVANKKLTQYNGSGQAVTGNGYVLECSVPFSALSGTSNTAGQTITLANSNLWTGKLQTTGGSTGPVLLAGVGFVIASVTVVKLTGNKKLTLKSARRTK